MSHILEFTDLVDTPNDFSGFPSYYLKVNSGANAVEFQSAANLEIALGGPFLPLAGGTMAGDIELQANAIKMIFGGPVNREVISIIADVFTVGNVNQGTELVGVGARPQYNASEIAMLSDLSSYLPLSAGITKPLTGDLHLTLSDVLFENFYGIYMESLDTTSRGVLYTNPDDELWLGHFAFDFNIQGSEDTFEYNGVAVALSTDLAPNLRIDADTDAYVRSYKGVHSEYVNGTTGLQCFRPFGDSTGIAGMYKFTFRAHEHSDSAGAFEIVCSDYWDGTNWNAWSDMAQLVYGSDDHTMSLRVAFAKDADGYPCVFFGKVGDGSSHRHWTLDVDALYVNAVTYDPEDLTYENLASESGYTVQFDHDPIDDVNFSTVKSVIDCYQGTGLTAITTAPVDIPWQNERKVDAEFIHAASSAEIEFDFDGDVIVTADFTGENVVSGTRREAEWFALLDNGGGYAEIAGTRAISYHRTVGLGQATASMRFFMTVSTGDKIKFQGSEASGTDVVSVANGSRVVIEKLEGRVPVETVSWGKQMLWLGGNQIVATDVWRKLYTITQRYRKFTMEVNFAGRAWGTGWWGKIVFESAEGETPSHYVTFEKHVTDSLNDQADFGEVSIRELVGGDFEVWCKAKEAHGIIGFTAESNYHWGGNPWPIQDYEGALTSTAPTDGDEIFNSSTTEPRTLTTPDGVRDTIIVKAVDGLTMSKGDLAYIYGDSSGIPEVWLADADSATRGTKMLVCILETIDDDETGLAVTRGVVDGFSSLTPSGIQYMSGVRGDFTETPPSGSGDIVRVTGYAISATEIFFDPGKSWVEIA